MYQSVIPENGVTYNSYADNRAPMFNQWTKINNDNCNEQNRLRLSTKPMKYYVNQYNSPQVAPFMEFTDIGNQKAYNVENNFSRPIPTRLNPLYPTTVEPYLTTPFLGQANDSRLYSDTSSFLRFGNTSREPRSVTGLTEIDYARFNPAVSERVVQNAGQFTGNIPRTDKDGYYEYFAPNNISLGNDAVPYYGISSRNLAANFLEISKC
jgi:hypothetical protein